MIFSRTRKRLCVLIAVLLLVATVFSFSVCSAQNEITSLADLKEAKVGVVTGTVFDRVAMENIENPNVCYYNTFSDLLSALETGQVQAYVTDAPVVKVAQNDYPNHKILKQVSNEDYAFIFPKDNAEATALCEQFNAFLAESKKSGLIDALDAKWFGADEDAREIDYSVLEKNTGRTLKLAVSSTSGAPFAYTKNGRAVGFDLDVAFEFCKANNYRLKIDDYDFSGILSAVQSGMDDFGASCITITEERAESMLFSDPDYSGGSVVVINDAGETVEDAQIGFLASVRNSFTKTFLRESRWRMFLTGIGNTMFITVISILFGTVLGFAVYMLCRNGNKVANTITGFCVSLVRGTPAVVLLMILFYLVFGKSGLDGKWVAVVGFTLTFAASVFGMIQTGVGAVDRGQNEAAFALGFGSIRTFFRVILPQAAVHFLPIFRTEVVAHIKATAIVGYIAVQDLTKISDIVRTRTYEAFFPLIATALIYFLLEGILVLIVKNVQFFANTKRRSPEKILKGIQTK